MGSRNRYIKKQKNSAGFRHNVLRIYLWRFHVLSIISLCLEVKYNMEIPYLSMLDFRFRLRLFPEGHLGDVTFSVINIMEHRFLVASWLNPFTTSLACCLSVLTYLNFLSLAVRQFFCLGSRSFSLNDRDLWRTLKTYPDFLWIRWNSFDSLQTLNTHSGFLKTHLDCVRPIKTQLELLKLVQLYSDPFKYHSDWVETY